MTLDASGNLSVGTTSAVQRLNVFKGPSSNNAADAGIAILRSGTTYGSNLYHTYSTTVGNADAFGLTVNENTTLTDAQYTKYLVGANGVHIWYGATTSSERARITSGGYFKASDSGTYLNSSGTFHELRNSANEATVAITNTNASLNSQVVYINTTIAAGTGFDFVRAYANSVQQLQIRGDGNLYNFNGTYGTLSDQKLKKDIVDAGSQWSDIKAIRFRKFKIKDDPSGLVQLGVVAQEVELTSPGLVDEHADRDAEGNDLGTTTKSVKTSVLLMKAAVALQEAMARIETLEAEVAALKGA
jgi:hypothetical protein